MSRPVCCRRVAVLPASPIFKPAGIPARDLAEVVLSVDEFEALRLADYEGLYQEQAAERMAISRQTFGRIVEAARKKVAQALVNGMVLRIAGGQVEMAETRAFECTDCGHVWEVPFGTGRPPGCPACESKSFRRAQTATSGSGGGRGHCRRHRNGAQAGEGRGRRHRGGKSAQE
jgi:predicted DNA-binding protein (UPF0251 family)